MSENSAPVKRGESGFNLAYLLSNLSKLKLDSGFGFPNWIYMIKNNFKVYDVKESILGKACLQVRPSAFVPLKDVPVNKAEECYIPITECEDYKHNLERFESRSYLLELFNEEHMNAKAELESKSVSSRDLLRELGLLDNMTTEEAMNSCSTTSASSTKAGAEMSDADNKTADPTKDKAKLEEDLEAKRDLEAKANKSKASLEQEMEMKIQAMDRARKRAKEERTRYMTNNSPASYMEIADRVNNVLKGTVNYDLQTRADIKTSAKLHETIYKLRMVYDEECRITMNKYIERKSNLRYKGLDQDPLDLLKEYLEVNDHLGSIDANLAERETGIMTKFLSFFTFPESVYEVFKDIIDKGVSYYIQEAYDFRRLMYLISDKWQRYQDGKKKATTGSYLSEQNKTGIKPSRGLSSSVTHNVQVVSEMEDESPKDFTPVYSRKSNKDI
jgi:hypothetical protein